MTLYLPDPGNVVGGLVLTLCAGGAARWTGAVSSTGFWAGLSVGFWISLGLGSPGLLVAGTFFLLGSLATRWRYAEKEGRGVAEPGGGSRGAGRVLAKGAVGATLAVAGLFDLFHPALVRAGLVGAFAAAAADTLGTEIGQVMGKRPFRMIPFRRVSAGTPGAVSAAGLGAGLIGAFLVAACAVPGEVLGAWAWVPAVAVAGLLGSVAEALLEPLLRRAPLRDLVANLVTTASGAALAAGAVALLIRLGVHP
jgi:uncharacterized protein (TIGR00297 family)